MKLFIKIFSALCLGEIILGLAGTVVSQKTDWHFFASFLHILQAIFSYPLVILDRSYPFYAPGPAYFGMVLAIVNVLLQTAIIFLIVKPKQARRKG